MNTADRILVAVTTQQDYIWFLALLGWAAAGGLLARVWTRPALAGSGRWAAAALIAAGAVHAGTELIAPMVPTKYFYKENLRWDWWVRAAVAAEVAALGGLVLAGLARVRLALGVLLTALGGALALRLVSPTQSAVMLAVVGAIVAWIGWRRGGSGAARPWQTLVLGGGAAALLATTGPLAEWTVQSRRWTEFSPFAPVSGAGQIALAAALATWLWQLEASMPAGSARQELRRLARGLALWLAAGLALAAGSSALARRAYESALRARALAAVAAMDSNAVAACLGPEFKLLATAPLGQETGRKTPVARAPFLLTGVIRPPAADLSRIEYANRECRWAHLMTLRGGHLVSWVFAAHMPGKKDLVTLHHPITTQDRLDWTDRRNAIFEGPLIGGWGKLVRVRAPLVTRDRRMLGWVAIDFGVDEWLAVQAQARLMAFALTAAGVVLAGLFFLQRVRTAERETARRAAEAAAEADRAKTLFLAKVSHELRTPLQGILGYGELLATSPLTAEARPWLSALRHQGLFLTRLVNDLVDLAALEAGAFRLAPRAGDLAALVRAAAESLLPRARAKDLGLEVTIEPGVPVWLEFDADRLRQILLNLLGNALKFTETGGIRVTLRPNPTPADAAPLVSVELEVRDTGPGIAPEDQARLFRPFSRLDVTAGTEGAGLGLALTAALCRGFGGDLRVESDGEHGSAFIARFALASAATPGGDVRGTGSTADLAGRRVLVADDNTLVRELFLSGLRAHGAVCTAATDGLDALERCEQEPFDTVVLDLSMPWLDGVETARRLRAGGYKCRIVGVSAHASAAERAQALGAGMDAFLVKPIDLAVLAAAVAGETATPLAAATDPALRARLRSQFAEEAARLGGELRQAMAASDLRWLQARAHYLKNSADIASLPELSRLCGRIHDLTVVAADPAQMANRRAELPRLVAAATALLAESARAFASIPEADQKTNTSEKNPP